MRTRRIRRKRRMAPRKSLGRASRERPPIRWSARRKVRAGANRSGVAEDRTATAVTVALHRLLGCSRADGAWEGRRNPQMSPPVQASNKQTRRVVRPWPIFPSLSGYVAKNLSGDVAAGLTLAAIAIPEQMATARLGGVSPELGFVPVFARAIRFPAFA